MKKIIISLSVVAAVAAAVVVGTTAFFSDTETSTGNTFTAGAIDLTVDNTSYRSNDAGAMVLSEETSWLLDDLTGQLFFNFSDLKPGDIGEDTISLHVDSNDAYLCAAVQLTDDSDQSCTEPEMETGADPSCSATSNGNGELDSNTEFAFWADDGDNVYEVNENTFLTGKISDLQTQNKIALADNIKNVWGGTGALQANTTKYIGKAWCFGDLTMTKLAEDTTGPLVRPNSATCSGADVNNAPQTDRVMGDIQFYAVQARNNPNFTCASGYTPVFPGTRTLVLENKDAIWDVISDGKNGTLTYNTSGDTFNYTLVASGLSDISYSLIYYADKDPRFQSWGGDNPGKVIGTFTASGGAINSGLQTPNLGMDLPESPDWNINPAPDYCDDHNGFDDYNTCVGAKIWLVPTSDLTGGNLPLASWNPANYLFETDLINYNDTNN